MKLTDIAIGNLKRRKSKIIFIILGMMIGIATIVSIYHVTLQAQADIEKKIDEFGANIMIIPKSNTLSMTYGGITIPGANYDVREIHEDEIDKIRTIKNNENLSIVSPKLLGATEVQGEIILLVGADLSTEIKLKKWWKFEGGGSLTLTRVKEKSPVDPTHFIVNSVIEGLNGNDVIIGSKVAEKFNLSPGDMIVCSRDDIKKEVKVKAIISETGSQDDSIIFMNLDMAQVLLGKEGKISLVEIAALCAGCPVEEMAAQINGVVTNGKATPIKQVVAQRMHMIGQISNFGFILGIIIILIGSLIVFTTMTASVNERQREIGIFRAIGFRRTHIMRIIFTETVILSFLAGIIGYTVGIGSSVIFNGILGNSQLLLFNPLVLAGSVGMAVIVGLLATLYPALNAARIDPATALRQI
ncbi:MAG: ABC transporter permease [Spirochaetales bacterium]|nr:ABC transporter permease [Spirochaetales bacterium]